MNLLSDSADARMLGVCGTFKQCAETAESKNGVVDQLDPLLSG
jgi:hypothetical protein